MINEESTKPLYFWREADVTGWLSQWYYCPFRDDKYEDIIYKTAEHYMMYQKAVLFGDLDTAAEILGAEHPSEAKDLGRNVKNFNEAKWVSKRESIVVQGNFLKFTKAVSEDGLRLGTSATERPFPLLERSLRNMLLQTQDREIVEASPYDNIWGIGYSADDADQNRLHWGSNLLGKALMTVRDLLSQDR